MNSLKNILNSIAVVYRKPVYYVTTIVTILVLFWFIVWIPNLSLFSDIAIYGKYGPRYDIFSYSIQYINLNFNQTHITVLAILSILTGINLSLSMFYVKNKLQDYKNSKIGFIGTVVGIIGVGCLSCGSVILSTILGLSTTLAILRYLPFNGWEFSIIGIIAILISIKITSDKIQNPQICKIK